MQEGGKKCQFTIKKWKGSSLNRHVNARATYYRFVANYIVKASNNLLHISMSAHCSKKWLLVSVTNVYLYIQNLTLLYFESNMFREKFSSYSNCQILTYPFRSEGQYLAYVSCGFLL